MRDVFLTRPLVGRSTWFALTCAIAGSAALTACEVPDPPDAIWVQIPAGAPVEEVAESLAVHQIVSSAEQFAKYAQMGRRHRDIKPGLYPLRPGTPMGKVLVILRKGRPPVRKVIVRERMTIEELAAELETTLGLEPHDVLDAARDSALRAHVGAPGGTVEGYLYPTAYYVNRDASAQDALRQMADTFLARWDPAWNARLDSLGASRHEIVTLASIIAGEMPHPDERLDVASVYHNRLARGMRLQADPTVVYALGERRRLSYADYGVESEYNTYTINGLPPGPIGQPSVASIEAALYPAETEFLYFVGRADGRHEFSRTYREHLQTIRRVRGR